MALAAVLAAWQCDGSGSSLVAERQRQQLGSGAVVVAAWLQPRWQIVGGGSSSSAATVAGGGSVLAVAAVWRRQQQQRCGGGLAR